MDHDLGGPPAGLYESVNTEGEQARGGQRQQRRAERLLGQDADRGVYARGVVRPEALNATTKVSTLIMR